MNAACRLARPSWHKRRWIISAGKLAPGNECRASALHSWDVTPAQAVGIQQTLRQMVVRQNDLGVVRRVAGVDVGLTNAGGLARAAVVVLSYPEFRFLGERPRASCRCVFHMCRGYCLFVSCR